MEHLKPKQETFSLTGLSIRKRVFLLVGVCFLVLLTVLVIVYHRSISLVQAETGNALSAHGGLAMMQNFGIGVIVSFGVIVLVLYLACNAFIFKPLSEINRQVELVEKKPETVMKPERLGSREFIYLARRIGDMADRIYHTAHHDALTCLPNRRLFGTVFEEAAREARRNQTRVAVFYLDIDKFKFFNDTQGHHIGDLLLKAVGARLVSVLDSRCLVSREGGDEFHLLASGLTDIRQAEEFAQLIKTAFEEPYYVEGHPLRTSVSIGFSVFPDDGDDLETLRKNADEAMYCAKKKGRGGYQPFAPEIHAEIMRYAVLEQQLREAIDAGCGDFQLYFQPILNPETGQTTGCEALIRWNTPQGLIGPQQFIPTAEETGLIIPLSRWLLTAVCTEYRRFRAAGFDLMIAVNMSAQVILHDDFVNWVDAALQKMRLLPNRLEIEITEATLAEDATRVSAVIDRLRKRGVSVTIDDFGTGYSSLSYFRSFAVDGLKIDRSFVQGLPSREAIAIIEATMAMARALDLAVTAEGVETETQLQWLRSAGCQQVQGEFLSEPLPVSRCLEFLVGQSKGTTSK